MRLTTACLFLCLFVGLSGITMAANRFWVASGSSNWNNAANWSTSSGGAGGASIPGAADAVTFNGSGLGNCIIDIDISVKSINVNASYTGTISQGANIILTSSTASFSGGSFAGGSADITIDGVFTINGAAFTSTTAVLELHGNSSFSGGSFIHNNGTVKYNFTGTGSQSISGSQLYIFNVLEFVGTGHTYNLPANAITVLNRLDLTGSSFYNLSSGTIQVKGDINVSNSATGCSGTGLIDIDGTGDQYFTGSSTPGLGALPKLTINKASGTLHLVNYPTMSNDFTYTTGTVDAGASTFCFTDGSQNPVNITGDAVFNNIEFIVTSNRTFKINTASTLTAEGSLTLAGSANLTLNTGNIYVHGDIFLTNTSTVGGGSATINITGNGDQTLDGTAVTAMQDPLPHINIDKAGGTFFLKGMISVAQDWTYTNGTVDATTGASTIFLGGGNLTVMSAGMDFYNITIPSNTITLGNDLTIHGDLTISGTGVLSSASKTINLSGNWINRGTAGFTESNGTVNFNGVSLQTLTSPGGENFKNLVVSNAGPGIQLVNDVAISTSLTMAEGNIDLNGNTLTLGLSATNNGTLARTGGTILGAGSFTRWLKTSPIADGSVAGLFPSGTAAEYMPISVSAPVTRPTSGGTITVAYTPSEATSATSFSDGVFTVFARKNLNWNITTGNGLAGGVYNLRVSGAGFGATGSVSDLRLTLANSVAGDAGINGGTLADPEINRTGLSLANLNNAFYIGTINAASATLPVALISFTAIADKGKVKLDWKTAEGMNITYCSVQRSKDAVAWENIKQFDGPAAGKGDLSYTLYDQASGNITALYYRIMLINPDGTKTYSSIRQVNLVGDLSAIAVHPNPATTHIVISFPTGGRNEVFLLNGTGQMIKGPTLVTGDVHTMNISTVRAGVYFLVIRNGNRKETRKIVKL